MKRYILTGAPGAGKTVLVRALEVEGHAVVEEAATDVIALAHARGVAEPERDPVFIDTILDLQRRRQMAAAAWPGSVQIFDRSPICTYALSLFLGYPPSAALTEELDRIERERVYEPRVLFVENLGFVTPTAARRISFAASLDFEAVHRRAYADLGYDLVSIPAGTLAARLEQVGDILAEPTR
jgi:predicted ATPase